MNYLPQEESLTKLPQGVRLGDGGGVGGGRHGTSQACGHTQL